MPSEHGQGGSAEYHAAHLAFARVGIVEAAAQQQPILDCSAPTQATWLARNATDAAR